MPAAYRIDVRAGVVYSVFEDHVTNEERLDISNDWGRTRTSGQR
jgi:hypothetical protein